MNDEEQKAIEETTEAEEDSAKVTEKAKVAETEEIETRNYNEKEEEIDESLDDVDKVKLEQQKMAQEIAKQRNEIDVNNFLLGNPEYSKYKDKIMQRAVHPAYKNIPVKELALIVAGRDLVALGAEKERNAVAKQKASVTVGTAKQQKIEAKPDWANMSSEECQKRSNEMFYK